MKTIKPDLLCSSIALALLLCAGNAAAADSDEAGAPPAANSDAVHSLDQITVTARGVSEPLQQMPLPITAMSEQIIEKKGLTDARDIATLSPSFSFKSAYGRGFDRPRRPGSPASGGPRREPPSRGVRAPASPGRSARSRGPLPPTRAFVVS